MRVRSLSRRVRTPSLRRWCSGNTRRLARTSCSVSPTSPSGTTFQPRPRTPMSRFLCVGDLLLPPPSILPSVFSDRYASSSSLNLNSSLPKDRVPLGSASPGGERPRRPGNRRRTAMPLRCQRLRVPSRPRRRRLDGLSRSGRRPSSSRERARTHRTSRNLSPFRSLNENTLLSFLSRSSRLISRPRSLAPDLSVVFCPPSLCVWIMILVVKRSTGERQACLRRV